MKNRALQGVACGEAGMSTLPTMWRPFYPRGDFRARVLLDLMRARWLIRWRWIILLAAAGLLAIDRLLVPEAHRPFAVYACVSLLGMANTAWIFVHGRVPIPEASTSPEPAMLVTSVVFTNAQMIVDLVLLTVMLRFTGGVENPLVVFYLFHVVLAAQLLRSVNAWVQGAAALTLYSVVVLGEWTGMMRPHYPFLPAVSGLRLHEDGASVLAAIGALAVAISGCLLSMMRISRHLDVQEQSLETTHRRLCESYQAIQKMQAQRARFTWTAAHQLKSPVAVIQTLAGLIRDGVAEGERVRDVAERIIRRCAAGIEQVSELLMLARIEQNAPDRHRTSRTDVEALLMKLRGRFEEPARAKGVTLDPLRFMTTEEGGDRSIPPDTDGRSIRSIGPVWIAVNDRDFEDCLGNVLDNALKYTPPGGRVEVWLSPGPRRIEVVIRDTGIGIAEESSEALFEPFRRGNTALQAGIPGSGLGLAIVKEVLDQAGGEVVVRSSVGQGTTVILTLPRAAEGAD